MSITPIVEPTTSTKNARIGYANLLTATTTSAASVMLIPNTYERYRPSTGSITVKFQLSASAEIDFVGLGAHNAGTQDGGVDVLVQYATTIGGGLTTIDTISTTSNEAQMLTFAAVTVAEIAITFNATTSGLEMGVIYAGKALEMQRPIYGGHSPITLNGKTEYQSVLSDTGNFLGRTITTQGVESSFNWKHLEDDWIRSDFMLFVESAKTKPFFMKWRPDYYDTEAVFGFTTNDVSVSNMGGGHRLMNASFNMLGHV